MPTRRNPAYAGGFNDPSFAAAASGLGQLFAPPSGADAAGFANAGKTNLERSILQEMFDRERRGDPIERLDGLNYLYRGNYGNTVSGEREKLRSNETIATGNQNTDLMKTIIGPTAAGAYRAPIPSVVANRLGLTPAESGAVQGVVNVGQGDTSFLPDGRKLMGAPKPLTEEQLMAQIIGDLPKDQQTGLALGGKGMETVVGENGKPQLQPRARSGGLTPVLKPEQQTEITRLIAERDALPPGDPNRAAYDQRIQALGRGQQQSAYDRDLDESMVKLGNEIFTAGKQAVIDQGVYGTILAAVDNPTVDQGTLGAATLGLRKALNAFGVNAGNTAPAEMLNALGNQLSLKLRDPSQGQGMPGAMSDADRQFLQSMSVGLGNSPQANKLLAQYYLAAQQRNIDLERLRQEYVGKNGRLDEGFRTALVQYAQNSDPTKAIRDQISGAGAAPPPPAASGAGAAPPPPAASGGAQAPVKVASPEEARKLPSGTAILLPDGSTGRVP